MFCFPPWQAKPGWFVKMKKQTNNWDIMFQGHEINSFSDTATILFAYSKT